MRTFSLLAIIRNAARSGQGLHLRVVFLILASAAVVGAEEGNTEAAPGNFTGDWITVVATGYSGRDQIDSHYHTSKGDRWRWITADGTTDIRWKPYGVAVPLKTWSRRPEWAFGTRLYIPASSGYVPQDGPSNRVFTVDDVGNGKEYFRRKGGMLHVDLRFKTQYSAIRWGERVIRVFKVTGEVQAPARVPVPTPEPVIVKLDRPSTAEPYVSHHHWLAVVGLCGIAFSTTVLLAAWSRRTSLA